MHTFIKNLLNGQSVEWKPLGEVLVRTKGTKITAGQMKELHQENAPIKIFAGGKTFAMVDYGDIPEKDINQKPSIIVKSRGIIEFEYYDKPFSHKNEMWAYHSIDKNIDIKFVYYFLKLNEPFFQNLGSKMQMPQIATPDTDKFKIPIPPLEIQQKIVQILDAFTTVTAELTAEYNLRVKQYQYYRDLLLDFNHLKNPFANGLNVEWKGLGEVAKKIYSGKNKEKTANGIYSIYGSTGIIGKTNIKAHEGEKILVARVGANAGFVHIAQGEYDVSDNTLVIEEDRSQLILKYLYYVLEGMNLNQFAKGAGQPLITGGYLKSITIPIPPLEIQTKIVEILDKFETLTHSISEGLPREIQLRQKQYEYYRELLLNFDTQK
ncbi:hypothetical protein MOVS_10150 [Moraxella ovis]|uniref:Type I restriction enzyme specificity protein MPN_089 n=1 Tax=Moraxella ovis TaxID=29433 RepID=A0A378PMU4_9GAMM|nr:restriction endonuclease subunit S [Moraxella ovis]ANB92270.1 hypothetical protein MOVS_10150 [Moraxella ovis]STY88084.1 Type I restriction enzyme specificity protein MPN_089 [Moraxella ovis]